MAPRWRDGVQRAARGRVSVGALGLAYLRISARERWTMCVILTACASAFVYGLFEKGLGVPFPDRQLLVWLGLIR